MKLKMSLLEFYSCPLGQWDYHNSSGYCVWGAFNKAIGFPDEEVGKEAFWEAITKAGLTRADHDRLILVNDLQSPAKAREELFSLLSELNTVEFTYL